MNKELLANKVVALILFIVSIGTIFIENNASILVFMLPFVGMLLAERENVITGYHPHGNCGKEIKDSEDMKDVA